MPQEPHNVFISYAREDTSLAKFIARLLERWDVQTWLDQSELAPGDDWKKELEKHLENANLYVLLITPSYLESRWGNFELGVALARAARSDNVTILPLTFGVSPRALPPSLRSFPSISLEKNDPADVQKALETALRKSA